MLSQWDLDDEQRFGGCATYGCERHGLVESHQPGLVGNRERKQVDVGELAMAKDMRAVDDGVVEQA